MRPVESTAIRCTSGAARLNHALMHSSQGEANGKDIRVGGGVSTIRQYLQARLIDEMHVAVSPVLLGKGENLWSGIDLPSLGYERKEYVPTEAAGHYVFAKR